MYTWNEIYENAIDKACGSSELRAKDEARFQVRNLTIDLGAPPLDESEVPEDVVEDYCKSLNIKFDECGNIVSAKFHLRTYQRTPSCPKTEERYHSVRGRDIFSSAPLSFPLQ